MPIRNWDTAPEVSRTQETEKEAIRGRKPPKRKPRLKQSTRYEPGNDPLLPHDDRR